MELNAIFRCKESQFESRPCVVEKIIELNEADYWAFRQNMLRDQDFIKKFNDAMRLQSKSANHCLLLLGEGCDDGILVSTEGYDYARYSSFIPGAKQILAVDQLKAEQIFKEQMAGIGGVDVDNIRGWMFHARALSDADAGTFGAAAHYEYLSRLREFGEAFHRIDCIYEETPAEIFNGKAFCRPDQLLPMADWISNGGDVETAMVGLSKGVFDPLDYAVERIIEQGLQIETDGAVHYGYDEVQGEYGLSADQMPQLFTRLEGRAEIGQLLLYDNRAAFTLCFDPEFLKQGAQKQQPEPLLQEDLEAMYARHILWGLEQSDGIRADFSGRVLSELDFAKMSFYRANFAGATIHQCRMGEASFEESDFTGAILRGVSAYQAEFTDAKFIGATLEYSEFDEAQFDGADFSGAEITECDGLDDIAQGPAMAMEGGMA